MEVKINPSRKNIPCPVSESYNVCAPNSQNKIPVKVANATKSQSFHFSNLAVANKKQMSFYHATKNYAGSDLILKENGSKNNDIFEVPNIIRTLISLGYSLESINMTHKRYKFKTLQQALNIMNIDETTGRYQHSFFSRSNNTQKPTIPHNSSNSEIANMNTMNDIVKKPQLNDRENSSNNNNCILNLKNQNDLCIICNDVREKHFDYGESAYDPLEIINFNQDDINSIKSSNFSGNINYSKLKEKSDTSGKSSQNIYGSATRKVENINFLAEKFEKEFLGKELCIICYENEIGLTEIFELECGHKFCKRCVNSYLTALINEAKVSNIKCLQAGCQNIYSGEAINLNVAPEIYEKYKKFQKRINFLEKIRRGMIPCIAPDCEEWVGFNEGDNMFVKCELGHEFCAVCKGKWHSGRECQDVIINFIRIRVSRSKY